MPITDVFRLNSIKAELEAVTKERDTLRATLVGTERLSHAELTVAIAQLHEQHAASQQALAALEAEVAKKQQGLAQQLAALDKQADAKRAELNREFAAKRRELVEMDETILLQSFGLYTPRYALASAEAYQARLEQVRAMQAAMVKAGTAAAASQTWTVNNSAREGAQMVKDYVKLILRAFNTECEDSIAGVKFNNVDNVEKRIRKAFETLNKLGSRMHIAIAPVYLNLKIEELFLCHEHQVTKQVEREEQRQLRERLREEQRVAREIEELKQKVDKEATHFTRALEKVAGQLARATTEAERALLDRERAAIEAQIAQIARTRQDILNREQNTRAGHVYIISNVGAFGEQVYKIGVTRRLDPEERVAELGDASVPFGFDIHALIFSDDAPALEAALHRAFEERRLNLINRRREFFRVTLDEIRHVVRTSFAKPVEFIALADAPEYRQSLALRRGELPALPAELPADAVLAPSAPSAPLAAPTPLPPATPAVPAPTGSLFAPRPLREPADAPALPAAPCSVVLPPPH
jgi:hypothetical protein